MTGVLCKVCSVFCFVASATLVKLFLSDVPVGQIVFFRSLFAVVLVAGYIVLTDSMTLALKTARPWGIFWRSAIGMTSMFLAIFALQMLPIVDTVAIGYTMPLFAVVFAFFFHRERVTVFRWLAVSLGFAGVLVICWPKLVFDGRGDPSTQVAVAAMVLSAALAGLISILLRTLTAKERSTTIVLYFCLGSTLIAGLTLPFQWQVLTNFQLGAVAGGGLLAGLAQILLTESLKRDDVSLIAPFEYTSILFSLASSVLFFDDELDRNTLIGVALVVVASLVLFVRRQTKSFGS